jgi:hypothetical protein
MKDGFGLRLQVYSTTYFNARKILRYVVTDLRRFSYKVPVIFFGIFQPKLNFPYAVKKA